MVTQSPRAAAIAVAGMFILSSIALSLFVWHSLGGSLPLKPKGYRFHALFQNASQLEPNAAVRIAGVDVGRVVNVRPAGLRTDATIELDSEYAPLSSDARAILRQKTLLGETFVALTAGSKGAPNLHEGATLPTRQIAPTQPLDRVLGMLDERTRHDLQSMFSGGASALGGRGDDLNNALGELDPVTRDLEAMVRILDRQRPAVGGLVRDSGAVLQTLGDHRDGVRRLVRSANAALSATDGRDRAVTETVRRLPAFLRQLRATSAAVRHTTRVAAPTLRELRPVAPLVAPGLRSLRDLAPQVQAVLRELDTTMPVVRRALPATARMVSGLVPFVHELAPAAREITPVVQLVAAYRREVMATVANTAAASQATAPGLGGKPVHYLRNVIPITEEGQTGYEKRLASNRHNAYFAPGGLNRLAEGLLASSCANTGNAQTVPVAGSGAPPCREQPAWEFAGVKRYFPHLERLPQKSR
jgi:virulence factor Mce-like protein